VPAPIVVIVEDDIDLREALCELLDAEGVDVVRADDGKEALNLLRGGLRPNVLLLDLMMPKMNGIEFRRQQLQEPPEIRDVPLVVLSGWAEGREEVKRLGVAAVLAKPVSAEELCEVLRANGRWLPA